MAEVEGTELRHVAEHVTAAGYGVVAVCNAGRLLAHVPVDTGAHAVCNIALRWLSSGREVRGAVVRVFGCVRMRYRGELE